MFRHSTDSKRRVTALLVAAGVLLAACGSDDNASDSSPPTTAPPASSVDTTPAAEGPSVVASTSWVAAVAELAGASDVEFIAPNSVQHPPDYEPTASDLAAVADADFVVMAGFEGFAERLSEAAGDAEVLTVMPSYTPATLKPEIDKLAAAFGTEDIAAENFAAYEAGWNESLTGLQAATADSTQVVVAQVFVTEWATFAGFEVAGTYGPAPATATEIADLADLDPTLVLDNVHMGGGAEIADNTDATLVSLANFPGDELDLLSVVDDNALAIAEAVGVEPGGGAAGLRTRYPLTIDNCGTEVTFERAPEKALLLYGASVAEVETMIVLGLEDRIVANAQTYGASDVDGMVEQIAALPTGGMTLNENFEVPKEQVLALEPDLVISTWSGGFSEDMGMATREQLAETGINSFVTPSNCANGKTDATAEELAAYESQTYVDSFDLIRELGVIFDVQDKAEEVIAAAEARIEAIPTSTDGEPLKVLVAYPSMGMMMGSDVPSVFAGPLTDSIIEAAGGVNSFDGFKTFNDSMSINAEALAAADVDVLVIGVYLPDDDPDAYAEALFAQYPQWTASQNKAYTVVAESVYLGPFNDVGIQKIADAIAATS
jgi:iron complex transport system substrate-binding protein